MSLVTKIDERLAIIDSHDLGMTGRTSSYVLLEEDITLFEPSSSPSVPYIKNGLKELGIKLEDISNIVVTHIHLDHAGGAGLLLESCPNAKVIVHPKGARHLINPSRLIAGAKAVYGEKFEELFSPIVPISEDRILIMNDGESLRISQDSVLTFYDTPGHANHHFSILDHKSNSMFTGDTIGIFYQELLPDGLEFYLPSTSPNQFDPEAMAKSAAFYESLKLNALHFSHYGVSPNPQHAIDAMRRWLPIFLECAQKGMEQSKPFSLENAAEYVKIELQNQVFSYLDQQGIPRSHRVYDILALDLSVCAMGLVDTFYKKMKSDT
ncbi:MBL fold metallo-hydrolase [Bacillus idriensis]|uniref:MBL fold metallo-hydrolase n=1 Tax=Metabacillus idriensis TaxID=324768 RepID=A0A6I2M5D3_9BACI|nr:MBL fold metallo-hydrolase [Metabacillus idriensis]MRX53385.1 MBL fold metallo-hydrolase [Metabacillus idriensis]